MCKVSCPNKFIYFLPCEFRISNNHDKRSVEEVNYSWNCQSQVRYRPLPCTALQSIGVSFGLLAIFGESFLHILKNKSRIENVTLGCGIILI